MEKQIIIENPWYDMINSPEQAKRRQARMKRDQKVWRKKKRSKALAKIVVVVALAAAVGAAIALSL